MHIVGCGARRHDPPHAHVGADPGHVEDVAACHESGAAVEPEGRDPRVALHQAAPERGRTEPGKAEAAAPGAATEDEAGKVRNQLFEVRTELAEAVVRVEPMTKTNWALGSPCASSVSWPVSCAEVEKP